MDRERRELGLPELVKIFLRSFLIQASWSYERMQSIGFAYAMLPALRKLYPDKAEFETRLALHTNEYFNTQPYLASFILGAAARLEQERASGRDPDADVSGMKAALMAPLGALGDSFFWGSLKPLAAVIAVSLLMLGVGWAPLLFLIVYNVWHLGLRAAVLFRGYQSSGDAMSLMTTYRFTRFATLFKAIALAALGGLLGTVPFWRAQFRIGTSLPGPALSVAALLVTALLIVVLRKGGSPVKLMLGLAAVCCVLAYAGVV